MNVPYTINLIKNINKKHFLFHTHSVICLSGENLRLRYFPLTIAGGLFIVFAPKGDDNSRDAIEFEVTL